MPLYIRTALLYFVLLLTESQSSSLNIRADGLSKSALNIVRAARFCNFDNLSILAVDVDPPSDRTVIKERNGVSLVKLFLNLHWNILS